MGKAYRQTLPVFKVIAGGKAAEEYAGKQKSRHAQQTDAAAPKASDKGKKYRKYKDKGKRELPWGPSGV